MQVFISQPMAARSSESIKAERNYILDYTKKLFPNETIEERLRALYV